MSKYSHIIKIDCNNIPSTYTIASDAIEAAELLTAEIATEADGEEAAYTLSEEILQGFESDKHSWADGHSNTYLCVEFEIKEDLTLWKLKC